jgi:hypothetical protein
MNNTTPKLLTTAALSNQMSLDQDTQEQLRALLQAEARRINQQNFEWRLGASISSSIGLFFAVLLGAIVISCSRASNQSDQCQAVQEAAIRDFQAFNAKHP